MINLRTFYLDSVKMELLPVLYSCGPSQIIGIIAVPYYAIKYSLSDNETDAENYWTEAKFSAYAMIPLVGTFIAIDATRPVKDE